MFPHPGWKQNNSKGIRLILDVLKACLEELQDIGSGAVPVAGAGVFFHPGERMSQARAETKERAEGKKTVTKGRSNRRLRYVFRVGYFSVFKQYQLIAFHVFGFSFLALCKELV